MNNEPISELGTYDNCIYIGKYYEYYIHIGIHTIDKNNIHNMIGQFVLCICYRGIIEVLTQWYRVKVAIRRNKLLNYLKGTSVYNVHGDVVGSSKLIMDLLSMKMTAFSQYKIN